MYYRNPDYLDVGRLTRELQARQLQTKTTSSAPHRSGSQELGRLSGLVLSMSMIALPAIALFLFLGVSRVVNAL
jgi:hypothetical protein